MNKKNGFAMVEVIIACAIISVVTLGIMTSASKNITLSNLALKQTQASYLLEEGFEGVRVIRDTAWANISNLSLDTNYYLSFDEGTNLWSISVTPNTIDSFTRTVVFSAVNRDSNDDIAVSGTNDIGTRMVTVTVSWLSSGNTASKILSFYLTDIFS